MCQRAHQAQPVCGHPFASGDGVGADLGDRAQGCDVPGDGGRHARGGYRFGQRAGAGYRHCGADLGFGCGAGWPGVGGYPRAGRDEALVVSISAA